MTDQSTDKPNCHVCDDIANGDILSFVAVDSKCPKCQERNRWHSMPTEPVMMSPNNNAPDFGGHDSPVSSDSGIGTFGF